MSQSLHPIFTLISLALLVCSLFQAVSAVPQPNPSVIYGPNGDWECPQTDYLGVPLIGERIQDPLFICVYVPYLDGQESSCQYSIDTGELMYWPFEDNCNFAVPVPQRKKRETNFTAMEEKIKARAALPQATVPQYMHTRRHVRRLRSGSAPHHGW